MMKLLIYITSLAWVSLILCSCQTVVDEEDLVISEVIDDLEFIADSTISEEHVMDIPDSSNIHLIDSSPTTYAHFNPTSLDTIRIGTGHEYTELDVFFRGERFNVFVIVEEGEYYCEGSINVTGENIIIVGKGNVSLYCSTSNENVMWVTGKNIVIDNLHMMHKNPGDGMYQNCTGRVIAFDMADSITVQNCDLNGCGLAGLHDNLGNGTVFVENNYIHNNSLGVYTDISGGVWQEEVEDHPVFQFKNNRIEDNGPGEEEQYDEGF